MGMAALALGSVVGGLASASAAKKGAEAQSQASERSVEEQRRQYDLTRSDYAPYRQAGYNALAAQQSMLGLAPAPMTTPGGTMVPANTNALAGGTSSNLTIEQITGQPTSWQAYLPAQGDSPEYYLTFRDEGQARNAAGPRGTVTPMGTGGVTGYRVGDQQFQTRQQAEDYINAQATGGATYPVATGGETGQAPAGSTPWTWQTTPGYEFRLSEGQKALERAAAARGIRMSGATLNAAQGQAQGMASNEFWNVYNALGQGVNSGLGATQSLAGFGANAASNIGNALMAGGQAQAQGYQGVNNAIQGTLGNLSSVYGMYNAGYFK